MTGADFQAVKALYDEPGTLDYMKSFFETDDDDRAFFDSYVANMYRFYDFGMYVIEDKVTGCVTGHVGLGITEDAEGEPLVTLGYVTGSKYRRKSQAYWACRSVLFYAQNELQLERVDIQVHPDNTPSIRLARKLERDFPGFVRLSLAN